MQRIEDTNLSTGGPVIVESGATRQGGLEARTVTRYKEESVEQRIEAGRRAAEIIKDFPLLGVGGGTFHIAFIPYQPFELRGFFDHAHNDYVEFGVESGGVGLALLAAIVLLSVYYALRILIVRRNRLARGMAFASLMGVVALMIHSVVDFNLQIPANALMFIVVLSLPYLVGTRSGSAAGNSSGA
jgi:O-antigen ligase